MSRNIFRDFVERHTEQTKIKYHCRKASSPLNDFLKRLCNTKSKYECSDTESKVTGVKRRDNKKFNFLCIPVKELFQCVIYCNGYLVIGHT